MLRIDTHQHFWKYNPREYPWIKEGSPIARDFLPADLAPLLKASGFDACVAVEARQTIEESRWLLKLAEEHAFIAGVVGWVDLRAANLTDQLSQLTADPKFVGIRHALPNQPDENFLRGMSELHAFGLTCDLLLSPKQLSAAAAFAERFPKQIFVLDHMGKPPIRDKQLEPWAAGIRKLDGQPNVRCKISGIVTEARPGNWRQEDFRPYLDVVWDAFGEDRLMVGSDWPVCLRSAEYAETMDVALDFLDEFQPPVRAKILGLNAVKVYGLNP